MTTEPMTHSAFTQFILRNTWIFAKTYAAFCPHEYVVKERLPAEEQAKFSVYDAADIWLSNGKDEDYMFGYTEEELERALR